MLRLTQRRWCYLGRWVAMGLPKRGRRSFLRAWDAFYDAFDPIRNFLFYVQHPRLWLRLRRGLRLLRRTGFVEVEI